MSKERKTLIHAQIYTPDKTIESGYLKFNEDGKIVAVGEMEDLHQESFGDVIDIGGKKLLPGFIDVHVHGGDGYAFMEGTYESIDKISQFHARNGTTAFLATTNTASKELIIHGISGMVEAQKIGLTGSELIGVHLEGPFINEVRSGAQDKATILKPDLNVLKEFIEVSENSIKLVTLASELDEGLQLVNYLVDQNITASMGHSDAKYDEVLEAVRAGVNHTTHHFNGMRGLHHRDPGLAGAGLLLDEITTELIADGFHVHPAVIKHLIETKGINNVCLITDAVFCAGLPDGEYDRVTVTNGEVNLKDGSSLAGSSLTMIKALRNVMEYSGYSLEKVLPMLTQVPARQAGVADFKGTLEVGKDADFLVVNKELEVMSTYVRGQEVYICSV